MQLGFGARRKQRTTRAELGHAKKAGLEVAPQVLRVFPVNGDAPAPGAEVKVDIFAAGERVKVTGTTKGRGFQGVVKRYGFGGGPATHGNTRHRKPGSISPGTDPSRVIKGKRMPGHMGAERHTELGLTRGQGGRRAESAVRPGRHPGRQERHRHRGEAGRAQPP